MQNAWLRSKGISDGEKIGGVIVSALALDAPTLDAIASGSPTLDEGALAAPTMATPAFRQT